MSERFTLVNLRGLIDNLNSRLYDREQTFSLGDFVDRDPKRNPFIYSSSDRVLTSRGKFQMQQMVPRMTFQGVFGGILEEKKVGYIFVEEGQSDVGECGDGNLYTTLRFRLKRPVALRGGQVIPTCSVKILREEASYGKIHEERRDHLRLGLFFIQKDLRGVLPTDWFYSQAGHSPSV